MTWLVVTNLVLLLVGVVVLLAMILRRPTWLQPEQPPHPRHRGWSAPGLDLVTLPVAVGVLTSLGATELFPPLLVLLCLGIVALGISFVKGPTDADAERRT